MARRRSGGRGARAQRWWVPILGAGMEIYSTVRPPAQVAIVVAGLIMMGFPLYDWFDGIKQELTEAAAKAVSKSEQEEKAP